MREFRTGKEALWTRLEDRGNREACRGVGGGARRSWEEVDPAMGLIPPPREHQEIQLPGMASPEWTKRRELVILPQPGRDSCHSLLSSSLSWTLSPTDHIIFLNTLIHYRAHFLSVNISNLIWHRNSHFSFSLNKPFPLLPGGLRQKHLRQRHQRPTSSWEE